MPRRPAPPFARAVVLGLLAGFPSACERVPPRGTGDVQPTLADLQARVFDVNCALSGCHRGASAPFGLDLTAGRTEANLVGVPSAEVPGLLRVDPGNPNDSYLIIKVEGGARIAPGTSRMPLGRSPLASEQIQAIRQWIASTGRDDAGATDR